MENKEIPVANIRVSSQMDEDHGAKEARLNSKADGNMGGGWSAMSNNFNQWLQVDIGDNSRVTGVATQGMNGNDQWVSRYRIQYSSDGVTFEFYNATEDSSAKVWLLLKRVERLAAWPHFDLSAYFMYSNYRPYNAIPNVRFILWALCTRTLPRKLTIFGFRFKSLLSQHQVFYGNQDSDTVVKNVLIPPITARYIRLMPVEWHNHISMRVEIYGCSGIVTAFARRDKLGAIPDRVCNS